MPLENISGISLLGYLLVFTVSLHFPLTGFIKLFFNPSCHPLLGKFQVYNIVTGICTPWDGISHPLNKLTF